MAADVRMVPADLGHAVELEPLLREADRQEVIASSGRPVLEVLIEAVEKSAEAWALYLGGELACIWGVWALEESLLLGRVGAGWMLTTRAVERYAKAFWQTCCVYLPRVLGRWGVLVNAIDVRHVQAMRWARRLGFMLKEPAPFGAAGLPFASFAVTKESLRV